MRAEKCIDPYDRNQQLWRKYLVETPLDELPATLCDLHHQQSVLEETLHQKRFEDCVANVIERLRTGGQMGLALSAPEWLLKIGISVLYVHAKDKIAVYVPNGTNEWKATQ
jgi:hypothetical protein